ncbi:MAG: hypothetical protein FWD63_06255 [Propionibacteriaceae bacterium]|nr:hypothetical protein [Propionibacteriaceae bacterium]
MWAMVGVCAVLYTVVALARRRSAAEWMIAGYVGISLLFGLLYTIASPGDWNYVKVTHWVVQGTRTSGPVENFIFSWLAQALLTGGLGAAAGAAVAFVIGKLRPAKKTEKEADVKQSTWGVAVWSTAVGARLGGALIMLGGVLCLTGCLVTYGEAFVQALLHIFRAPPAFRLVVLGDWLNILGPLVAGLFVLVLGKKHLVAAVVVGLLLQILTAGILFGQRTPVIANWPWPTLLQVMALGALLAMALSTRWKPRLKTVAAVLFGLATMWALVYWPPGFHSWLIFSVYLFVPIGWLALLVTMKAPNGS